MLPTLPASKSRPGLRLPANAVVHDEVYRDEIDGRLFAYDAACRSRSGDGSWLLQMAREVSAPRRSDLRRALKALGFSLE